RTEQRGPDRDGSRHPELAASPTTTRREGFREGYERGRSGSGNRTGRPPEAHRARTGRLTVRRIMRWFRQLLADNEFDYGIQVVTAIALMVWAAVLFHDEDQSSHVVAIIFSLCAGVLIADALGHYTLKVRQHWEERRNRRIHREIDEAIDRELKEWIDRSGSDIRRLRYKGD